MRITEVWIKGFRSLGEVSVNVADYSSLIGPNDSGKSSFLHALHILFDKDRVPNEADICKVAAYAGETFVEATLANCVGHEDLAIDGRIRLRRICRERGWNWEVMRQVPKHQILKKMQDDTLTRTEWGSVDSVPDPVKSVANDALNRLAPKGKVPSGIWRVIFQELADNALVDWEPGWAPLDKERLSSLVTVVILEADMRGEEELADGARSVFSRVGGLLLCNATKGYPDLNEAVTQLNQVVQRLATADEEGNWPVPAVNDFRRVMREEIERFDGSISTHATVFPPKIPALEFNVKVEVSDQWIKGIDRMGHGLRRSVVFAMLRAHRRIQGNGLHVQEGQKPACVPLYLFLVEEPELYLHPQAERRRMEELQELAATDGTQVILCTHSAIFVDLRDYKGILRFERPSRNMSCIRSWTGDALDSNDQKLLAMTYQFHERRAAMLFAKHVVLVEGQTEKIMLPILARRLGCYDPDVEVVDCGGQLNVPVFQRILEGFGLRYVVWMDRDDRIAIRKPGKTNAVSVKAIGAVRKAITPALGRMIVLADHWESMTGVPDGTKPYNSWRYFVEEDHGITPQCEAKLRAAFAWEEHEDP